MQAPQLSGPWGPKAPPWQPVCLPPSGAQPKAAWHGDPPPSSPPLTPRYPFPGSNSLDRPQQGSLSL